MDLQTGMQIHGFTVTRVRDVPGTAARLVEMLYEKTNTELVWYKTDESNKLFNVIFKTLPRDSTGVFHILEHSLLCGSARYPVKEPFVELMKSTMSTFLNAITFPDKTMYPVGSRNEQDFLNLTQVYLDAAFAPRAVEDPRIFRQEGWHYELEEDTLSYNGVVFNEMKGAMSSMDEVIYEGLQEMMFPDTSYGFNSGGDPRVIPSLTFEQFCESYREHYHPSNARIYLDGSIPLERTLALIDGYLSKFTLSTRRREQYQKPRSAERTVLYEIGAEDDPEEKHQLVLGKILGTWEHKDRILAVKALCQVLCGSNSAPLKRAVLDAGLAQDVTMQVLDGIAQPLFYLQVHNMRRENGEKVRDLIRAAAENLAQTGLDRKKLAAAINRLAFECRDTSDPQAVYRCIQALDAWLYEGDPMTYLTYDQSVENLRGLAENGGFEALLRELLVDEENLCVMKVAPSSEYGLMLRLEEQAALKLAWELMVDDDLADLAAQNEQFHRWQQTPDSPGELAKLPVLNPDQVSPEPLIPVTEETCVGGVKVLTHEMETNGIVHLNAYFSLTDRSYAELPPIRFLATLLGKLPTENYDCAALDNQVKTWLGRLWFDVEVFGDESRKDRCVPCLVARCSVLKENLPKARELLAEILLRTRLDCPEKILEILRQTVSEMMPAVIGNGHRFAAVCASAHFSARDAAAEAVEGCTYFMWLKNTESGFEGYRAGLESLLRRVLAENICRSRMTLSITGEHTAAALDFIGRFPQGQEAPAGAFYKTVLPRKLGIRIPAQVSFACTGYRLDRCGENYRGTALLAANILSLSCLWNSVRVQGGAYGAGLDCDRSGILSCYSYRDPSPARSLGIYRQLSGFLRNFPDSGESLVKYIISTVASTEPLMKPDRAAAESDRRWFCGITREALLRERQELLSATFEDLLGWCPALEAMAEDFAICVLGNEESIQACEEENLTVYYL